jgi:hypothetical protein
MFQVKYFAASVFNEGKNIFNAQFISVVGSEWACLKSSCLFSPELAAYIKDSSVTRTAYSQSRKHSATSLFVNISLPV